MKMNDVTTYKTEPVDNSIENHKEVLADTQEDPLIRDAETRLKNLRKQKQDIQNAKKMQIANLDTQITGTQMTISALKRRKQRLKATKT
jgi:hypothetical protein